MTWSGAPDLLIVAGSPKLLFIIRLLPDWWFFPRVLNQFATSSAPRRVVTPHHFPLGLVDPRLEQPEVAVSKTGRGFKAAAIIPAR